MDGILSITIPGKPRTKGSVRVYGYQRRDGRLGAGVVNDNAETAAWCEEIALRAREELPHDWEPTMAPVVLLVEAQFARPKKHYSRRGGRYTTTLAKSAPIEHMQTPDCDKVARAVCDALTGTLYQDDRQVVELHIAKIWGENNETRIRAEVG